MKQATLLSILLLAGLASSAPPTSSLDDEKVTVTREIFLENLAIYTSQHDIVNLFVPLNDLNFGEEDDETPDSTNTTAKNEDDTNYVFFVEADIKENGEVVEQGLSLLKGGKKTKLLDNGRDFAADFGDNKIVYFAAKDGIYKFNYEQNTAEKYGSVTDSLIGIAKPNGTDVIYILTESKELYKVTADGNKKEKLDDVSDVQQIVLDFSNNLYYYSSDKKPYVGNADGIKKIEGLPENPTSVKLLRPPFVIEDGVPFIVDNKAYIIYANGTSELSDFDFEVKPSAFAMEATLIQYYAFEKKIYEYNLLVLLLSDIMEELKEYLTEKKDTIQAIASRPKNTISVGV